MSKSKTTRKIPVVLTKEEIHKLFNIIHKFEHLILIKTLYYTGTRVSECLDINIQDIDLREKTILIRSLKKRSGHLAERLQPIPEPFYDTIRTYLKLIGKKEGKLFNISRQRVWQLVKHYGKKAKLTKSIKTHTLRHSYATHIYEERGDIKIVQDLLGHVEISTTQIYAHPSIQTKKRAIEGVFK